MTSGAVAVDGGSDGGSGANGGKSGVVVQEVFSTDAIMRDLRKSYMAEKSASNHEN